jgi:hypothetical protein
VVGFVGFGSRTNVNKGDGVAVATTVVIVVGIIVACVATIRGPIEVLHTLHRAIPARREQNINVRTSNRINKGQQSRVKGN